MTRKTTVLLTLLLALFTLPFLVAQAQSETSVAVGDTINGELTSNALSAVYSLELRSGDGVSITLTSDAFDSYLTLSDPDGTVLMTDDDSAGGKNARIDFTASRDGVYSIRVDSYNQVSTGAYTLSVTGDKTTASTPSVTGTPPPVENVPLEGGSVVYGDTVNGTLAADQTSVPFTFNGQLGDHVVITLTSPDFDPYLTLRDDSGASLAEDDDSAGSLNAVIDYVLPTNGIYTIQVSGSFSGVSGAFTLQLESSSAPLQASPTAPPFVTATPQANTQGASISVDSALTDSQLSASYVFNGNAGDVISVTLTSSEFDAYLILQDANGKSLVEDDDSAGNLNAEISNFTLPGDGQFTVIATSNTRAATGAFTLTVSGALLQPVSINASTPEPTAVTQQGGTTITLGTPVTGTLSSDTPTASYTYTASGADTISITLTSDDFDTFLSLQDASGSELTNDDDSAGNLNSRIADYTLPGSGTYTIVVSSAGGVVSGAYTLVVTGSGTVEPTSAPTTQPTVEPTAEPTNVPSGSTVRIGSAVSGTLTDNQPSATYRFSGEAGEVVSITLTSDEFDPYLTLSDFSGVIATDDDSAGNLDAQIADFALLTNRTYTITVGSADNFGRGSFTLSITHGANIPPTVEPTVEPTVQPTATPSGGSTIHVGDTISGSLSGDQSSADYHFTNNPGQAVTISVTSTDFDTYVTVTDTNGQIVASDDDSGGNLNALIENFTVESQFTYTITVGSFDETGRGSYTLSVVAAGTVPPTVEPTVEPTGVPSGNEITIGSSIDGSLETGQTSASYTFQGEAGQVISITLSSSVFDSYLRLQDSSGYDLVTDDDGGGGLDAKISAYTLPSNGTYTIVAESYDGVSGAYTLSLSEARVEGIEYGQTVQDELTNGEDVIIYRFSGSAGDVVTISLDSPDFDTYLTLSDSSSTVLVSNDDAGGGSTNSRIGPYTLPSDGEYFISASSYDSSTPGRYTLSLNNVTLTPIAIGDSLDITFSPDVSAYYYQFDAHNGDIINVTVSSDSAIDTSLYLNGPDGYQVIFDADGGAGYDPEIFHQLLTQEGTYVLVIEAAAPGDSGKVTLSLSQTAAPTLDNGPQEIRLSSSITQDVVIFDGHAGETVRLTATITSGDAKRSPTLTVTQDGNDIASGYGTTVSGLSIEFTVPADGRVIVQLSDYDYTNVIYEVSLERISQ